MLIKAKTMKGYKLQCLDGEIGSVAEFYFNDDHWVVRYLVADTGGWLSSRQVLVSPHAILSVHEEVEHVNLDLTMKQIEDSPPLDADKPVSRQFEDAYYGYYGWPIYWGGPYTWGASPYIWGRGEFVGEPGVPKPESDHHLRSTHDVQGHNIQASDGEIGRVKDFVLDDVTWSVRYLIVDTSNWWPGKLVLIATDWIDSISWLESNVYVNLTRDEIKNSPEYSGAALISRDYEEALHQHYHQPRYWHNESNDNSKNRPSAFIL